MKRLLAIWNEDDGVLSFEWTLLLTLLTIGVVGGLAAARDAIIDELGDVAEAAQGIDQSFSLAALSIDFDGDGVNDLALGCAAGLVRLCFGGRGSFPGGSMTVETRGEGCWQIAAGDLDSDGRPDLVTGNADSGSLSVLLAR